MYRLEAFDALQATVQAFLIGDLDCQAGARVQLQNHRPEVFVDDDVGAEVTQPDDFMAGRRHGQDPVPERYGKAGDVGAGVRMLLDDFRGPGSPAGDPAGDIDPHPDRALMQVGAATGRLRRQARHCQHWVALENNDADIRYALKRDRAKDRIDFDQGFHHGLVRMAPEAEHARQDS